MKKIIPLPGQIRKIPRSFGWIDHRLLRDGWASSMSTEALALYAFFAMAADRDGVSFYRKEKISQILGFDFPRLNEAMSDLIGSGLIAFKPFTAHNPNGFFQVLEVPTLSTPVREPARANRSIGNIGDLLKKIAGGEPNGHSDMGRNSQA